MRRDTPCASGSKRLEGSLALLWTLRTIYTVPSNSSVAGTSLMI